MGTKELTCIRKYSKVHTDDKVQDMVEEYWYENGKVSRVFVYH